MDIETKEKLTEQQHQIEMLKTEVEANMKTLRADNEVALTKHEAAIDRLQASNEKGIGELRTDMARLRINIFIQMVTVVGAGIAILALILK